MSRLSSLGRRGAAMVAVFLAGSGPALDAGAQQTADAGLPGDGGALYQGFSKPPDGARPRVWWHWMNGNITKEGIKLDLDWMQRIGVGGAQAFDAQLLTPQVVDRRLVYMTPEWLDAMKFAVDQSRSDGLELAIASSAGWSETGGPWVQPDQAMKKLVWSETEVEGGRSFNGKLPAPPDVAGPFQDVPPPKPIMGAAKPPIHYYQDTFVVAFPLKKHGELPVPAVSLSNGATIDASILSDGVLVDSIKLPFGSEGSPTCIVYDYHQRVSISSLEIATPLRNDFFLSPMVTPSLQASGDGLSYRKVTDVPSGGLAQHTVSFKPYSARYFRVCFARPPPPYTDLLDNTEPGANTLGLFNKPQPDSFEVNELRLLPTSRINRFEEKAGFETVPDYYRIPTPDSASADAIQTSQVVDLTGKMQSDGTLSWTVPPGHWKVLRFGYSPTGKENQPATPEATGLEVDKLDAKDVRTYLDTYFSKYDDGVGKDRVGPNGISAMVVDSIEVGPQNWSKLLPEEFKKRRGYDLMVWMPALTGTVIGSAAASDRFLYDFRSTIAELLEENHYGQIAAAAHARGMTLYGEALEQGRPMLGDDMAMRRYTDVPMAAMWTFSSAAGEPRPVRYGDIGGAASVAHIYGQNLVAAESLTSAFAPWANSPRDLKPAMDLELALGVNRPVIHTSVHQPLVDKAPGLSLLFFGQNFTRNETWAEQAQAWISYISRASYLLQQGRFAADVLYFIGEDSPLTILYRDNRLADTPKKSGFDFADADVVLNRLQVERGDLVTASGMRYKVLYLGGASQQMTLPVLRRIADLVRQGATVVGGEPTGSPSLADDQNTFKGLADQLWRGGQVGKGRIIDGQDPDAALASLGVAPDFEFDRPHTDSEMAFLHRRTSNGDLFFLVNRKARQEDFEATFRVSGKRPEIWRPETGRREAVSYRIANGRTRVDLKMAPNDAFFVVFQDSATENLQAIKPAERHTLAAIDEPWQVSFQPGHGGPEATQNLPAGSWTASSDPAIRYFSGTATYRRELDVPKDWLVKGSGLFLDLGDVRELAEVFLNGKSLGVVWHPPYRVDITGALQKGRNSLEIRVTNLWVNRLIGDAQPGASKVTFTTYPPYKADAPLRESGLLGPVTIERVSPSSLP